MEDLKTILGVNKVINASGKMTILGGSRLVDEVSDACRQGASQFFEIADLLDASGAYIAQLYQVEAAYIVASASSGIAQCIATCICEKDSYKIMHLHDTTNTKREIILPKGHNVDYGTAMEVTISLGGGKVVEAGYANACTIEQVESCITENTVALYYVKSHHCVQKGICSMEEMASLAKKYNLYFIIDAAAEEDLLSYYQTGADAVIYSGTKALEGPTSGLVIGRKAFIDQLKLQKAGIGRVMKVGKENILGLLQAIMLYQKKTHVSLDEQRERLAKFHELCSQIPGISCKAIQDGAGRNIMRSELTFSKDARLSASEVSAALKKGDIHIYTRDYRKNTGVIEIDIRDVNDEELMIIYRRIEELLKGDNV